MAAIDVDWCLSCERHLSTDNHQHNCRYHQSLHVGSSTAAQRFLQEEHYPSDIDTDNEEGDDDNQAETHDELFEVVDARIRRWASRIPFGASPNLPAAHDLSRPPCLSVQPTRLSPPTLCLHSPGKLVSSEPKSSPVSTLPLQRAPRGTSAKRRATTTATVTTATATMLSAIASHAKSLVSSSSLQPACSTLPSASEQEEDSL
ncbi:hypothetical protein K435DRAFT_814573, partial [Dendrothele bispora CBS 962.96]